MRGFSIFSRLATTAIVFVAMTVAVQAATYISVQSGSYSSTSTWEVEGNTPASPPGANDDVFIQHTVELTENSAANSVTIESGGLLGSLGSQLTISNGGAFVLDGGIFRSDTGGVITLDGPNITEITFISGSSQDTSDSSVVPGRLTFRDLDISGTANMSTNVEIRGILRVSTNFELDGNAPSYRSGSQLRYRSGGTVIRGREWSSTTSGTPGFPSDVRLTNNTTVQVGRNDALFGGLGAQVIGRDLIIDFGSILDLNNPAMTGTFTVTRDVFVEGTLRFSFTFAAEFIVRRNFFVQTGGTVTTNGQNLRFEGSENQLLGGTAASFSLTGIVVDKTSGRVTQSRQVSIIDGELNIISGAFRSSSNAADTLTFNNSDLVGGGVFESLNLVTATGAEVNFNLLGFVEAEFQNLTINADVFNAIGGEYSIANTMIVNSDNTDFGDSTFDFRGAGAFQSTLIANEAIQFNNLVINLFATLVQQVDADNVEVLGDFFMFTGSAVEMTRSINNPTEDPTVFTFGLTEAVFDFGDDSAEENVGDIVNLSTITVTRFQDNTVENVEEFFRLDATTTGGGIGEDLRYHLTLPSRALTGDGARGGDALTAPVICRYAGLGTGETGKTNCAYTTRAGGTVTLDNQNTLNVNRAVEDDGFFLLVDLESFTATPQGDGTVLIEWVTLAEFDSIGFNVFLAVPNGKGGWKAGDQVGGFVPATGSETVGDYYYLIDGNTLEDGEVRGYILQDVETNGEVNFYGPVSTDGAKDETSVSDWMSL